MSAGMLHAEWLDPIASRIFALDPRIAAVVWALQRDGEEILEDWVPTAAADPRWPECLDDNPWLDEADLDELLTDACLERPAPDLRAWAALLPDDHDFHACAILRRDGVRWVVGPPAGM